MRRRAFGGGVVGLLNQLGGSVGSTAIGPSGWALFPLLDGDKSLATVAAIYAAGLVVGYVTGFLATYCFGFTQQMLTDLNVSTDDPATPPVASGTPTKEPAPAGPARTTYSRGAKGNAS